MGEGGEPPLYPPPSPVKQCIDNQYCNSENSLSLSDISNIGQFDGVDSIANVSTSSFEVSSEDDSDGTVYATDDEIEPEITPIRLTPVTKPKGRQLKVLKASSLPLVTVMNARSLYNKHKSFKTFLTELGIEAAIVSETWEREDKPLNELLQLTNYKVHSHKRTKVKANRQPGGACALIYNEDRFQVTNLDVYVPKGVEACWSVFKPRNKTDTIENIAIASVYVSPNSVYKTATINHIVDTIHLLRAKYDNKINYLIGGDLNRLNINKILDSYGPLRQIISVPTRHSATLENIITDLHTLYQQPECLPPLQVDQDKVGKDSDHNIIVLAPIMINNNRKILKKPVVTRPLTETGMKKFSEFISSHHWTEVLLEQDIDMKVTNFHNTIRNKLDEYLPEKSVMVSCLDKKWMSPQLKNLLRKIQREFYKKRKSRKWKKLKKKYKQLKKKTVRNFYTNFVDELKVSNPSKWYTMAKRLGAEVNHTDNELKVECLNGLDNQQSAEKIAEFFSKVSQEYSPLNLDDLPAYLPAGEPLQVDQLEVAERIYKLKNRKSTQPIDLPSKIRKESAYELSIPLSDIINSCLKNYHYPKLWKHEWVVPAPKTNNPKVLKELRKISLTSEFSLIFEGILKDWILVDISPKVDRSQYGNQKGTSTEHLLVNLMDRILRLIDQNPNRSAVIATLLDWSSAFDRQDPTLAIKKFLKMGVRPELVPVLASYLKDRQMQVKCNGKYSSTHRLPGGGPQGTLLGLIEYFVQSNDNADCVDQDMRFKYVDDLTVLELVMLTGLLTEYNFHQHVASDIGIDEYYVPATSLKTQQNVDQISTWTSVNLMQLNPSKSNYMVFSRSNTEFATRLSLDNHTLDRVEEVKLVGVWLTTFLDWEKNTREMTKRAYARMTLLTKLKYVGTSTQDLIDVYSLYIRSILEYCSVVWHSTLTVQQTTAIERVQKLCLKVILGSDYNGYEHALEICGLEKLTDRREARCLKFGLKSLLHPVHCNLFPVNPSILADYNDTPNREHFQVNWARTDSYRMSAIPYMQRLLNNYVKKQNKL